MASRSGARARRALVAASCAAALLFAPAAHALSPGNLFPTLTYPAPQGAPGADAPEVSTRNATCGLFGCRSDG